MFLPVGFQLVVVTLSAIITGLGVYGLVRPAGITGFAGLWRTRAALWFAVVLRLVFGAALWYVAPLSRAPMVLRVIGGVAIAAAIVLPVLGVARMRLLLDRWTHQTPAFIRTWSAAAALIGSFLIWAVAG